MASFYFDPILLGFQIYEDQCDSIPKGLVEVSAENYAALFAGQEEGKRIVSDKDGRPILADLPPPSSEALEADERAWRDARLAASDGVVSRHRDELEEGSATTLSAAQYTELQAYRRLLRNWPEAGEFPLIAHRPSAPKWLAEQVQ